MFADVGKQPNMKVVFKNARDIVKVFQRQSAAGALLEGQQQQHDIKKKLTMDCATRFSSKFAMLQTLLMNKQALQSTVVLEDFRLKKKK